VLLGHLLGLDRTKLLINSDSACSPEVVAHFSALIERRQRGEPVAYITGAREFWGLSFQVSPAVLVPRPESELMIEEALAFIGGSRSVRFIDLGAGSGCLSIALTVELQKRRCDVRCLGVDISDDALQVAMANALTHGVSGRVAYARGNWLDGVKGLKPPYDLIIANPPYIDPKEEVPIDLSFEPPGALFAEEHGLKDCRVIIESAHTVLRSGGLLLVEVGAGKRQALQSFLPSFGSLYDISLLGDDSSDDRFTVIRLVRR
jgi:release factor glutamine methyltransferase